MIHLLHIAGTTNGTRDTHFRAKQELKTKAFVLDPCPDTRASSDHDTA